MQPAVWAVLVVSLVTGVRPQAEPGSKPAVGFWPESFFPKWFDVYLQNETFPQSVRDQNESKKCRDRKVAVFYAGGSAVNKWDAGQDEVDKIMKKHPGCPITQINHLKVLDLLKSRWQDIPNLDEETTKDVCFSSWTGPNLGQIMFNLVKWAINQRYNIIFSNALTNVARLQELYDLVKAQKYTTYRIVMTITSKLHPVADLAWTRGIAENRFVALCLIHEGFRKAPMIYKEYERVFGKANVVIYDKTDGEKTKLYENGIVLAGKKKKKIEKIWNNFIDGAPQFSPVYMEQNMNQTILRQYHDMNLQCGTCGMSQRNVGKEFAEAKVKPPKISQKGSYEVYSDNCVDAEHCGKSVKPCHDVTFQVNCTQLCGRCYFIPPPFKPDSEIPKTVKDASGAVVPASKIKVFISYTTKHNVTALRLQNLLEEAGYATWMDHSDMPVNMVDGIEQGITESAVVMIMFNEIYSQSWWCRMEFQYVCGMRKPFILIKTDDWTPKGWLNFLTGGGTLFYLVARTADEMSAVYPILEGKLTDIILRMGGASLLPHSNPKHNTKSDKDAVSSWSSGSVGSGWAASDPVASSPTTPGANGPITQNLAEIVKSIMGTAEATAKALVDKAGEIAKSIIGSAQAKAQAISAVAPTAMVTPTLPTPAAAPAAPTTTDSAMTSVPATSIVASAASVATAKGTPVAPKTHAST